MSVTTISSRAFNQDVGAAKRAAEQGPVVITDRGEPAFVLLLHAEYRRLAGVGLNLRDALAHRGGEDIEFDPPKLGNDLFRPVTFD